MSVASAYRSTGAVAAWSLIVLTMAGCNFVGFVGQAFPRKVNALYRLPPQRTVVLVDDPKNQLGDPRVARRIAQDVGAALVEHRAVNELVDPQRVDALMMQLGDNWPRTGIDQIGRAVGSDQVVHLYVESAVLYPTPGLLQPMAALQVKVIDVVGRKRLFPSPSDDAEATYALTRRGHRIIVKLLPRGAAGMSNHDRDVATQQLAARMARDTARLFHDYLPRQPGEPFE